MKKPIVSTLLFLFLSSIGFAQTTCDSIYVDSVRWSKTRAGYIEVQAANHSSDLVGYPGFLLFNLTGDTIAKETVDYFGIGRGFQTHYLKPVKSFSLPATAFLQLYSGFYDSLYCTYRITVPDSGTLDVVEVNQNSGFALFPNPSDGFLLVEQESLKASEIVLLNLNGQIVLRQELRSSSEQIDLSAQHSGLYFAELRSEKGLVQLRQKILIR